MNVKQMHYGIDDIERVVTLLYELLPQYAVCTFTGSLGAGKTTLVKALLAKCGITEVTTSPTFTYVNVYENNQHQMFYHFDCYRIKSLQDFKMAGFDEYLYQPNSWAFIEWPEVIEPLLQHAVAHIVIDYHGQERTISIRCIH